MMEEASSSHPTNGLVYSVLSGDKTIFLDTSDEGIIQELSVIMLCSRQIEVMFIFPGFMKIFTPNFSINRFIQLDEICKKSRELPGAELCCHAD